MFIIHMIKKICAAICGRHPGPISPSTTRSYSSGPLRTMPRPSKPLGDAARRRPPHAGPWRCFSTREVLRPSKTSPHVRKPPCVRRQSGILCLFVREII